MATLAANNKIFVKKKNIRINFLAPETLAFKIDLLAKEKSLTKSALMKKAITDYIDNAERKIFEKELEDGYKANYRYYLNMDKEWHFADSE